MRIKEREAVKGQLPYFDVLWQLDVCAGAFTTPASSHHYA